MCPLLQNKIASFDPNCRIEQTSLLYVWEGTGRYDSGDNKYLMYAGESERFVPGRKSRLPSIYNINFKHGDGTAAPTPPTDIPFADIDACCRTAMLSSLSVFFGFSYFLAVGMRW